MMQNMTRAKINSDCRNWIGSISYKSWHLNYILKKYSGSAAEKV